ncbi:tetratricopeptide repeat protein [Paraburkholderia sp. LEh10]|uniref:tetratricopeptide repeat protein n=1 Tax=Paraburkholderia sp. LEh10 TaxID=2821353 RepID=UPI001AE337D9|nr:tetratricopeptide repeat protein [Paraburkholderia sp. LEh10]MBP0593024.1 tetratricopeptide repeat protein [Paraburkholderia sp. LEh10]
MYGDLQQNPEPAVEPYSSAASLYGNGRFGEALSLLEALLQRHQTDAQVLNLAAACCLSLDRLDDAQTYWRRAIDAKPDYCDAHSNLGVVLKELGRLTEAEACYRRALAIAPDHAGAYVNLGRLFVELGRPADAEQAYLRAIELHPGDSDAYLNLGVLYQDQMRLSEAVAAYRNALSADPGSARAHFNLGAVLKKQKRFDEAEASYRHAVALRPDYFEAKINLAHLLLMVGRLEEGWALFETRYDAAWPQRKIAPPPVDFPIWRGEPLAGKSLLVWPEQGHGDSLQFCRYLPMLKAQGLAKLSIACSPALRSLFETIDGIDECIPLDGEHDIAQHDYVCLTMSLPHRHGTTLATIPGATPYLRVPSSRAAKWRGRLPEGNIKVGLVWAGDPRPDQPAINAVDRQRSLDAHAYVPLLRVPGITFVSLQKGALTQPQINTLPPGLRPFDPMHDVHDFADTAAIIEQLDLVITVDTSIAHLAGALNKPVWILSRYDGCWRWLHDRDETPWYQNARLFRQTRHGHWDDVIERVTHELEHFANQLAAERSMTRDERFLAAVDHYENQRFDEGLALLRLSIETHQADARMLNLAAGCSLALGRASDAETYLRRTLQIDPTHADGYNNLGVVLRELGRPDEAQQAHQQAIAANPDHAGAHINLARLLESLGRVHEAEVAYRRGLDLYPGHADTHNNFGAMLQRQGRMPEAEACYRRALAIEPDLANACFNLGIVLQSQKRHREAEAVYRRALKGEPHMLEARLNLAHLLLASGQYVEGWQLFECRYDDAWKADSVKRPPLPFAQWQGEALDGRSIVVWPEQGYGDSLQFCRYLPMLKRLGAAKVTVACQPGMQSLIEGIEGVDACIAKDVHATPPHDYWCLMMSLPHRMGTTLDSIPATMPYLSVPPAHRSRWAGRLPKGQKVGLVWAGDPRPDQPSANEVDRRRSIDALAYLPLLSVPGITFVSLQKGKTTQPQIDTLPPHLRPFDPMNDVHDFADTAAIIEQLDLVITVDTSVAHLAGALNKPVWILSRHDGCWRWLHDRDDTPWYPNTRLFRQRQPGEWGEVIGRVRLALEAWPARERMPA